MEAEELGESSSDDDFSPDVLARDQLAQQAMLVADSVEVLSLEDWRDGREGKKAVMRLIPLLESSAPARTAFVSAHGMLVALEALRTATQREHVAMLLRVVNLVSLSMRSGGWQGLTLFRPDCGCGRRNARETCGAYSRNGVRYAPEF